MIRKCKDLKLKTFIEISEDIEKIYLLIDDSKKVKTKSVKKYFFFKRNKEEKIKITETELQNAWIDILDEYNLLVKTKNYALSVRKRAEIESLRLTISIYTRILQLMLFNNYEANLRVVNICKGLKVQPNQQSLERKIKGLNLKLKMKLNALPKGVSTSFEELKEGVERFRNFYIDADKVNVSEWASYLVAMQKQSEKNKPKQKNGR